MAKMSLYLFSAALITLVVSFGCYLFYTWKHKAAVGGIASMFVWMGAALLAGAWIAPWGAAGHAPLPPGPSPRRRGPGGEVVPPADLVPTRVNNYLIAPALRCNSTP